MSTHIRSAVSNDNLPARRNGFLGAWWHYLLITALTLIYYFPYLLPDMGNMHGGDFAWFYLPFRIYSSLEVHAGSWPFRAGELYGGYPIWQDPQFSLLYPVNLLFAVAFPNFASEAVIDLYMLLNMLILSWASVWFLRRLGLSKAGAVAGACVIAFCGYTINHAQYLAFLQVESMSLVASGLLVTFFRGGARDFRLPLAAGVALALGNLTGNPQPIVYFHYAIGLGVVMLAAELWRRTGSFRAGMRMAAGGAVMFVFGILLAVVHLLPSAYLIAMSPRAKILREAAAWTPLELKNYFGMLFPGFYQVLPWRAEWPPYQLDVTLSFTNLVEGFNSLGVFAVALGLLGWWHYRRHLLVHGLGIGCVLLLLCALGDRTPVYGVLYSFFPAISMLRVSARILLVFYPAWAVLVALGVQALAVGSGASLRQSRAVAGIMVALVAVAALLIFRGHDTWLNAWLGMMAEFARVYVLENGPFFMARFAEIMYGLKLQLVFGALFMVALVVLFSMGGQRWQRWRVPAVMGVLFVELFVYGFGWNMAINTPPLDDGVVHEYLNYPGEVKGRSLGLHGKYHGSINAPIYMKDAPPIANGYSVTFDKWVGMFLPVDEPPVSEGVQKVLYDLWNVTDIHFPRWELWAELAGVDGGGMLLGDWGWTPLRLPPPADVAESVPLREMAMPSELMVNIETTRPVEALHLLVTAAASSDMPDGAELGLATVLTAAGDWTATMPLIMGEHVSDMAYPENSETDAVRPRHAMADVAFRRMIPNNPTRGSAIYDVMVDLPTSVSLSGVHFQVTAPYPARMCVSHVVAMFDDGTAEVMEAFETAGFKKRESRNSLYFTLGRDHETGFVRLLPTAVPSSYKRMHYPFARVVSGEIDPLKTVVVDKRQIAEEDFARLNAPDPATFDGTATVTWLSDERARVEVETNQPGWVFLSYAWDAGWRAEINGEDIPLYRGSGAFITFPVDAGTSVIEMRYRPQGLVAGAVVSLLALVGLVLGWRSAGRWERRFRD